MSKQVPTNCMDEKCEHNSMEGLPDFPGTKEVCTVHFECALGHGNEKDCPLVLTTIEESTVTPWEKILLWYRGRKKR